jgi:hypothetical protein
MDLVAGVTEPPGSLAALWAWIRDPLIPTREHPLAAQIRAALDVPDGQTSAPVEALDRLSVPLEAAGDADPKLESALRYLRRERWAQRGCILFSQYLDTVTWLAEHLAQAFPAETIGVYGGQGNSFLIEEGKRRGASREEIQAKVRNRSLRLLAATDAASEEFSTPGDADQRRPTVEPGSTGTAQGPDPSSWAASRQYRNIESSIPRLGRRSGPSNPFIAPFADPRSIRDHSRHIGGRLGRDCTGGARGGSAAHRRGATATSIRPAVCARPARNRVGAVRAGFGSI